MQADKVAAFVALQKRAADLDEELKGVKEQMGALERELLTAFEADGISTVKQNGTTVYLQRQLWASARDGDYGRACAALRAAGLGDLVQERFNSNQVSAYVRELDRDGTELPETVRDALHISEVFSLRTRSS